MDRIGKRGLAWMGWLVLFLCPAAELKLRPAASGAAGRQTMMMGQEMHWLVPAAMAADIDRRSSLAERGVVWVEELAGMGWIVRAPIDFDWPNEGIAMAALIDPSSKLSPALAEEPQNILVVMHRDIEAGLGEGLVASAGLEVQAHPDLSPGQVLTRATLADAARLAYLDEVAYIFPAAEEIAAGEPVMACLGNPFGQYVATVGDGWDGPGKGGADLTYWISRFSAKQPQDRVRAEIERAFRDWERAAALTFQPSVSAGPRNIEILFGAGEHGDGYPFDGAGRVLAHTFFPNPPNPEPLAGDMHLDEDERWNIGADVDVYSVVLHELGHALGLGHSDTPGTVMYPYYRRVQSLAQQDINAIQTLYAPPGSGGSTPATPAPLSIALVEPGSTVAAMLDIQGTVTGGRDPVRVTWQGDGNQQGVTEGTRMFTVRGFRLNPGANRLSVQATDGANATVTRSITIQRVSESLPRVAITSPASGTTVTRSPATLMGTATHTAGITSVTWSAATGTSGRCTGTTSWSCEVPLQTGTNRITVTAGSATGTQGSATLDLIFNNTSTTAPDRIPPTLTFIYPATTISSAYTPTIVVYGAAGDNVGVSEVRSKVGSGAWTTALGTREWRTAPIPLNIGNNTITVEARDQAGNSISRALTVVRR